MPRLSGLAAGIALIALGLAAAAPAGAQEPSAAQTPRPTSDQTGEPLKPGANSFAESQARQLLISKGYSRISRLVNDSDGMWRGTAWQDGRSVDVSVDFQGHVAAR